MHLIVMLLKNQITSGFLRALKKLLSNFIHSKECKIFIQIHRTDAPIKFTKLRAITFIETDDFITETV